MYYEYTKDQNNNKAINCFCHETVCVSFSVNVSLRPHCCHRTDRDRQTIRRNPLSSFNKQYSLKTRGTWKYIKQRKSLDSPSDITSDSPTSPSCCHGVNVLGWPWHETTPYVSTLRRSRFPSSYSSTNPLKLKTVESFAFSLCGTELVNGTEPVSFHTNPFETFLY